MKFAGRFALPRAARVVLLPLLFSGALVGLGGCHGDTLDVYSPDGGFGHQPPPAVNLPPQDAGMEWR